MIQSWDSALRDWWQHHGHDLRHIGSYFGAFHNLFAIAAGGVAVAVSKWLQRMRQARAAMWPSAPGIVDGVQLKTSHGTWAVVLYRYEALGERRYGKYRRHFRKKEDASRFADMVRGLHVQVRYREDDPSVSILRDEDLRMSGVLVETT